jgi:hypothetical protein
LLERFLRDKSTWQENHTHQKSDIMLSPKVVSIYGYISIIIMAVLLGLIFFEKVPRSFYTAFFIVALVLFLGRIVLRILLARQERRSTSTQPPETPQ